MSSLPVGAADPLHILEPGPEVWPKVIAFLLLFGALAYWLWKRKRSRSTEPEVEPTSPVVEPLAESEHFVDRIRKRFDREGGDFRQGCHALAEGLKQHLATETGKPMATLTFPEVEQEVGDLPEVPMLELLAGLQFRRVEPTRKEFHNACELTLLVSGGEAEKPGERP